MKIKKDSSQPIFSDCIRNVESQLRNISLHSFRIIEENGSVGGICILSPELSSQKKEAIGTGITKCTGLTVEHCETNKYSAAKISLLPKRKAATKVEKECGYDYFMENMLAISHQASMTRIPFSLLLLQSDYSLSRNEFSALKGTIQEGLNREEIFSVHEGSPSVDQKSTTRFAVIMPSAGLSKARRRSEELRQAVQQAKGVLKKNIGLSIGLGVSYAGEGISVQDFLVSVEKSLKDAAVNGDCTRWEKKDRSANSCQVTAEERAQLFGCLK